MALALCLPLPAGAVEAVHVPIIPILMSASSESATVSVVVDRGLRSSKRLRSSALRAAREALHDGAQISVEDLRALAEARDGLAAQRYVRHLQKQVPAATPSDIAYFAAIAVGTGRVWTLKPMIEAMRKLDPDTEPKARINAYIKTLYPHAWAGNSLALEALVLFNGEGRLFGPLSQKTRTRILAQAQKQGDGIIELRFAMSILETQRAQSGTNAAQMTQARKFLQQAGLSNHLAVRTTAQNLLRMIENT